MVEVEVPQRPDVLGLVAADLAGLASGFGARFTGALAEPRPGPAHLAVSLHVALDGGIGGEPSRGRIGLHPGGQVVVVQLIAPVGVLAVLEPESLGQGRGQGDLAAVLADGAAQGGDGVVVLVERRVVPAFDGDGRELDVASGHGMGPGLLGQVADGGLERTVSAGRAQERAHHGEAKPRPARRRSN